MQSHNPGLEMKTFHVIMEARHHATRWLELILMKGKQVIPRKSTRSTYNDYGGWRWEVRLMTTAPD